jgi:hypothetical protein
MHESGVSSGAYIQLSGVNIKMSRSLLKRRANNSVTQYYAVNKQAPFKTVIMCINRKHDAFFISKDKRCRVFL